jgi:hypothetical protein
MFLFIVSRIKCQEVSNEKFNLINLFIYMFFFLYRMIVHVIIIVMQQKRQSVNYLYYIFVFTIKILFFLGHALLEFALLSK